ncbi:haloacid dehalogenase [Bacteroidia bacterium]|nr:haloacid dehalogenase [Bacteroidia bacterium]
MKKQTIVVFDFDGTITVKDSFVEIIKFSKGKWRCYAGFLLFAPLLVAMKLKLYPNGKVKQQIFSFFFKETKLTDFNAMCENFAGKNFPSFINLESLSTIEKHKQSDDKILIISASIESWVRHFAEKLGIIGILCTKIEIDKNKCLTGKFSTANCYGQEKVNRLLAAFPNRNDYYLIAYGDSRGDKEMIDFADEGYYNKFK